MQLEGKVALVTGGAGGIGRVIAQTLIAEGAAVAIMDLSQERAEEAVGSVGGSARASAVSGDVADPGQAREAIRQTLERWERLDILVNGAGLQYVAPVVEYPEEKWELLLGVMLTGTFLCTKYALPAMLAQGWGRVINLASAHGLVASPFKSAYVAAKHGVVGFTKALALETAESGITANAICPGYVRTRLVEAQFEELSRVRGIPVEEIADQLLQSTMPQRKFVTPAEVAGLVVFLCSEAARGITGAALSIDGGWLAR